MFELLDDDAPGGPDDELPTTTATRVRIATAGLTVTVEAGGASLDAVVDRALMLVRECAPLASMAPRITAGGMGFSAELCVEA